VTVFFLTYSNDSDVAKCWMVQYYEKVVMSVV